MNGTNAYLITIENGLGLLVYLLLSTGFTGLWAGADDGDTLHVILQYKMISVAND